MRQAGRYLPEYREERKKYPSFIKACESTEFILTVTRQPLQRFPFDYSIIFSDILFLYHILGVPVRFEPGVGPLIDTKLDFVWQQEKVMPLLAAITELRRTLPQQTKLIGFAGSIWTIMTYLLEGKGSKMHVNTIMHCLEENTVIDTLVDHTIHYLSLQIEAGVDIIKLFDSWAGSIPHFLHEKLLFSPTKKIVDKLRTKYPHIPIICFPRGLSVDNYLKFVDIVQPDAVALDQYINPEDIPKFPITTQGNLDPHLLLGKAEYLEQHIHTLLEYTHNKSHIYNLGHGILPPTPIENVEKMCEMIKKS